jgi:hypothetical protein
MDRRQGTETTETNECECLEQMCRALEPHGVWVDRTFSSPSKAVVSTSWRPAFKPKRGQRVPVLLATFCPFCGVRYEPDGETLPVFPA